MLALLAGYAMVQGSDPIARFASFLDTSKTFTLEYTIKDSRTRSTGTCKYEMAKPNMESFSCKWESESFKYIHGSQGGISVRDDLKVYDESYPLPKVGYLPDSLSGVCALAYPMFLFPPTLRGLYPNAQVKGAGTETIRGKECDKVVLAGENGASSTFWIDKEGKVWRWNRVSVDQQGMYTSVFELTKFDASAPSAPSYYAAKLPLGYVPFSIPRAKTFSLSTEAKAPLGTWFDVRRESQVDVTKSKPFVVVFTDPACTICAKIEPFLADLRRKLKPKGCALIEVSLGSTKPNTSTKDKDRTVFWDKDGAIERAFGTPGTPFFFVVDKEGVLVAGFQGYTKELEPTIVKTLTAPFEPD